MTEDQLILALRENPFVLAPMAGITDHAFRSFMKKMGAGIVVTELVSADGIKFKSDRTLKLMSHDKVQHPVAIQLFGDDPNILADAARVAEQTGCDFVDLNFGCPVPKVTKKGAGSAMLKDLVQMEKVLKTVKSAIQIPLTIKIRTGWDSNTRNADLVCRLAHDCGITWVAIHGRTRAQNYEGFADWDYIAEVKAKAPLPVLGNGDILTSEQAVDRMISTKVDGVLIGRGCLKNPYLLMESKQEWAKIQSKNQNTADQDVLEKRAFDSSKDFTRVFLELKSELEKTCDDHIQGIQLKKFASWYSTGYPGASQFRKIIFSVKNNQEVVESSLRFFESQKNATQQDQSQEKFLMGGHG
ncbi:MAG: tRNA dihydrouridine synthase DusB [Pseudobdellovibrionaceae bacterium]